MKEILVRQLMVPLREYATVHQDATLYEAVISLKEAQERYVKQSGSKYPHRAVLVVDDEHKVVGKLSQLDILMALEPKYKEILRKTSGAFLEASALSGDIMKKVMEDFLLFEEPLKDICKIAFELKVKDCMYSPKSGEYVEEDENLAHALYKFIAGRHQSLLVLKGDEITGILRLTDVFEFISQEIITCKNI
ncbi:MAG: CBS domain-containing protein [Desulfatiglandales bacterium]